MYEGRRLATAVKGSTNVSYTYNESGIRTTKTVGSVVHEYILDGTKIVAEKWGVSGATHLVEYIYDANSVIGMIYHNNTMSVDSFEQYVFEKNLQGDIVAVYSASGTLCVKYTYDAWGNVTTTYYNGGASNGAQYNSLRYRGYYYDTETGLYYLNSRYYDPAIGRFINADVYVSTGQGLGGYNMYAYCRNEPVFRRDSLGTEDVCVTNTEDDDNPLNDLGKMPSGGSSGRTPGKAPGKAPTTKLYRSVCPEEANGFIKTGKLSTGEGQMEGKFFATSVADTKLWGEKLGSSEIISIRIPTSALNHSSVKFFPRLDAIGPAYYFSDLSYLNSVLK